MEEIKNSYKLPMDTSMAPDKVREVSTGEAIKVASTIDITLNPIIVTPNIVDNVYNNLINTEGKGGDTATGIPTGSLGLTKKLHESLKVKTGNSSMTEEEASRYYINELYTNLSSLPGYTNLNNKEQETLIDTAYNVGWSNMSKWTGFAKGLAAGNKEDAFRNLLDTANTQGGSSKGIAKRRAHAYNEAFPDDKITKVVQTKDGLEYYKGEKLYFNYDNPPHKSSKIGTLKL